MVWHVYLALMWCTQRVTSLHPGKSIPFDLHLSSRKEFYFTQLVYKFKTGFISVFRIIDNVNSTTLHLLRRKH